MNNLSSSKTQDHGSAITQVDDLSSATTQVQNISSAITQGHDLRSATTQGHDLRSATTQDHDLSSATTQDPDMRLGMGRYQYRYRKYRHIGTFFSIGSIGIGKHKTLPILPIL